jgi:hypothetical protein
MNERIKRVIEKKEIDNDAVMSALFNDNKKLKQTIDDLKKELYKSMDDVRRVKSSLLFWKLSVAVVFITIAFYFVINKINVLP